MTAAALKQTVAVCWSVPAAFAFGVVFSEAHASGIEGYARLVKCSSLRPNVFNKPWGAVLFTVGLFAPACIMIGICVKIFTVSQRHTCEMSQAHRHTTSAKKNEFSKNKDRQSAKTFEYSYAGFLEMLVSLFFHNINWSIFKFLYSFSFV